jgi:hypothetical protein
MAYALSIKSTEELSNGNIMLTMTLLYSIFNVYSIIINYKNKIKN